MEIVIEDRYSATGIPRPNPETMCHECEGMGCYPVHKDTDDEQDKALWLEADARLRNAAGFFRQLWRHKEFWFWRSMFRDLWSNGLRNWACDDWHFVTCPHCNGTRLRSNDEAHRRDAAGGLSGAADCSAASDAMKG